MQRIHCIAGTQYRVPFVALERYRKGYHMLALSTVIASLVNGSTIDFSDVKRLAGVIRKHERASASFLADLRKLNADDFKRSIASLSASYRADLSKSGVSYDLLIPLCDSIHKATLALRNQSKEKVCAADKDGEGFNLARFNADICKVCDSMLSSVANLKSNAAQIAKEENKEEKAA
jgi:hypothetical protein